jgi:hypothetical protein
MTSFHCLPQYYLKNKFLGLFSSLPEEIKYKIFKYTPIEVIRNGKDYRGFYYPIIDKFIKDTYITEDALFDRKNILPIEYLLRDPFYKLSVENLIYKITHSYIYDYMKLVNENGGMIIYEDYNEKKPISLIVFRYVTSPWPDIYTTYNFMNIYMHMHILNKHIVAQKLMKGIYSNRTNPYFYHTNIEIVKVFYPNGFDKTLEFDNVSPRKETVLKRYL